MSEAEFTGAVESILPDGSTLPFVACAVDEAACSTFVIGVGEREHPSAAIIFRLEGGREPAIVGAVIDPPEHIETPFGDFDIVPLGPNGN